MRSDRIPAGRAAGRIAVAALALVQLSGCARNGGSTDDGQPDREELERLRALPYAGSSPTRSGEGRGVTFHDPERSQPGVNLYTIQMLSRAELIDESGRLLRGWGTRERARWERAALLENGDLMVIGAAAPPPGVSGIPDDTRFLMRFDWNGNVLWRRPLKVHHDVERTPDGRLAVLAFERRRIPEIHPTVDVRDDLLSVIDEQGEVVESRSLLDAFRASEDVVPLQLLAPTSLGGVPWLDLFHLNSLEWMRRPHLAGEHPIFEPGNVLVCSRHQNVVFVLSWERNEVVWAWGRGELYGPHDAQVLDNGHLLIFDNGLGRGFSRVVEVDPGAGEVVWEYRASPPESFYTISKGSSQRLENGNTLIADSDAGRAFEVTTDGEIVWEFYCPYKVAPDRRAAIVRMIRYARADLPTL